MPMKLNPKGHEYKKFYNETSDEDYDDSDDSEKFIDI